MSDASPPRTSRNDHDDRAWLSHLGFQDLHTVWFEAAGANGAVIGRKP